jgi:hypothetical protein
LAGFTSKLPADLLGGTTTVELSTVVQFVVLLVLLVVQLSVVYVS